MASMMIHAIRTVSGNQPVMDRLPEEATQTFLDGVPVQIAVDGGVKEWDGSTLAAGIAGFSREAASGLATVNVPKTQSFGSVPNQALAVNITRGAPLNDGKVGLEAAAADSIFLGQINPAGQTLSIADVGVNYGMTKDSDGHWYVDKTKTAGNAVVKIVALDDRDTIRGVQFVVLSAAAQLTT
jgi:hypothetical protein